MGALHDHTRAYERHIDKFKELRGTLKGRRLDGHGAIADSCASEDDERCAAVKDACPELKKMMEGRQ